jgi:hypothetical protein
VHRGSIGCATLGTARAACATERIAPITRPSGAWLASLAQAERSFYVPINQGGALVIETTQEDGRGVRPVIRLILYSGPLSMFGAKAEIAAHEKGLDFELVMVPFDMQRLYEPKHPEVVRVNPKRQVPVLIHGTSTWRSFSASGWGRR